MKELSTEEKAKRYDKALERANMIYTDKYKLEIAAFCKQSLERIFPELKESEEEENKMTREEEIKKQADIYTDDDSNYAEWSDGGWSDSNDIKLVEKAFIEGAQWADKTIIEKACKWIKENFENYVGVDVSNYDIHDEEFADDFRKAMGNE